MISPPKARDKKPLPSKGKQISKPGAVSKRPPPLKTAKSLDELLFNERRRSISRGPSNVLAQLRSVTVSTVPKVKREESETPSQPEASRRDSGTLKEKSANVISRNASTGRTQDQKAHKKAMVEAELQDAISALKKPNRVLAGKILVEETERRLFGGPTYIQSEFDRRIPQYPDANRPRRGQETGAEPHGQGSGEGHPDEQSVSGCPGRTVLGPNGQRSPEGG